MTGAETSDQSIRMYDNLSEQEQEKFDAEMEEWQAQQDKIIKGETGEPVAIMPLSPAEYDFYVDDLCRLGMIENEEWCDEQLWNRYESEEPPGKRDEKVAENSIYENTPNVWEDLNESQQNIDNDEWYTNSLYENLKNKWTKEIKE